MARRDVTRSGGRGRRAAMAAAAALLLAGAAPGSVWALSELPHENLPAPEESDQPDTIERRDLPPPGEAAPPETQAPDSEAGDDAPEKDEVRPDEAPQRPSVAVPLPDPIVIPRDPEQDGAHEGDNGGDNEGGSAEIDEEPVPDILYDLSLLPEPVRQMRQVLIDACLSGDIERLRPFIGTGQNATQLSFGDVSGDPVAFLRGLSGDEQGQEILAILYEILTAGFVKVGETPQQEMYVWPYFAAVPLEALTPPQRVELFKVVTAGDYEDMKNYGTYIFYRAGIAPDGRWLFFYAGD